MSQEPLAKLRKVAQTADMAAQAQVIDLRERMRSVGDRTRATVRALKGYRELNDQDIAEAIGWTRQKVQSYVGGPTKFTTEAISAFAFALDVPDHVLLMEKDDALRWVLDRTDDGPRDPAEQVSKGSPCIADIVPLRRPVAMAA